MFGNVDGRRAPQAGRQGLRSGVQDGGRLLCDIRRRIGDAGAAAIHAAHNNLLIRRTKIATAEGFSSAAMGAYDALLDGTEDRRSGVFQHFDSYPIAEGEPVRGRLPASEHFQHPFLGKARRAG